MKHLSPRSALALALVLTTASAAAQSWNYDAARKGGRGPVAGEISRATLTLEERDGKAFVRIVGGPHSMCFRSELPAVVARTTETTTIELLEQMPGCEPFRLVIRNDGSGGVREMRRGDAWVPAKLDAGLTPAK